VIAAPRSDGFSSAVNVDEDFRLRLLVVVRRRLDLPASSGVGSIGVCCGGRPADLALRRGAGGGEGARPRFD